MKNNDQSKAIREVVQVLMRWRWRFIIPAFIVTLAVLGVSLLLPRKYHAEAIFDRRTGMVLTELRSASTSFQDPRQSIVEQLSGPPAIERLRESLDPLLDERADARFDREEFYRTLNHRIVVRYDVQNAVHDRIRVEYTGDDPVIAQFVVNTLVQNYITAQRAEMDARLAQSIDFFRNQVERFRDMIEQSEAERLSFEMKYDSLLPDNPNSVQTLLAEIRVQAAEAAQQHEAALNTVAALEAELAQTPETEPTVVRSRNPEKTALREKLRQAENALSHSLNVLKMTERHPDLIAQREQIAAMQAELETLPDEIVTQTQMLRNPKRDELELRLALARADVSANEIKQRTLESQIAQLTAQVDQMHPVRANYRKLTDEVDVAQRRLNIWEESLWRVEMARTAESGNSGVQLEFIKPCPVIRKPVSPALAQVLAGAVALGLLSGALCVFFAHRTDETFGDGDDLVEAFNLPLFGGVSEIITRQRRRLRRLRNMILYPVNATAMATAILLMMGILYLDLERPAEFALLKENPAQFLRDALSGDEQETQHPALDARETAARQDQTNEPDPRLDPVALGQE